MRKTVREGEEGLGGGVKLRCEAPISIVDDGQRLQSPEQRLLNVVTVSLVALFRRRRLNEIEPESRDRELPRREVCSHGSP